MSIFNTVYETRYARYEKGAVLLFTLMVMIGLTSVVGAYLGFVQYSTRSTGAQISDSQAIYLAEAGLQKAIWNLKTPEISEGKGEDWTTPGTTENLGEGSYTMVVERWDWALAANNSIADSNFSEVVGFEAAKAIDDNNDTYWESADKPGPVKAGKAQQITITFPYTLTVNKARFYLPSAFFQQRPKIYSWQVSTDGATYTTAYEVKAPGNDATDVIDEFSTAQTGVNHLRLEVTGIGGGGDGVIIATLEAIGSKITVTGTVDGISREIEQTVAVDDASEEAYDQIDWNEND